MIGYQFILSLSYFIFLNMTRLPAKLSSLAPFQVGCCIYSDIRTSATKLQVKGITGVMQVKGNANVLQVNTMQVLQLKAISIN